MLGGLRARPNDIKARSSRVVDQPKRTDHYDCAAQCALLKCYTILGYSTETVLLIFPFLQTNITDQMRPSGD